MHLFERRLGFASCASELPNDRPLASHIGRNRFRDAGSALYVAPLVVLRRLVVGSNTMVRIRQSPCWGGGEFQA